VRAPNCSRLPDPLQGLSLRLKPDFDYVHPSGWQLSRRRVAWYPNSMDSNIVSGSRARTARASVDKGSGAQRCRRKFLRFFPGGFRDPTFLEWERDYKWETHERWLRALDKREFRALLRSGAHAEVATRAVRVEQQSRHSMIFSFEKMALRDAVKTAAGSRAFAEGLFAFLHGGGPLERRFNDWVDIVAGLPRRQTRVLTWPLVTVFGFIAQPTTHFFVKPIVTRTAAREYGFELAYVPRPNWETYAAVLEFAERVRRDQRSLRPRDMIDLQSFIWVQGSDEYD
jgi:hypothetical protein